MLLEIFPIGSTHLKRTFSIEIIYWVLAVVKGGNHTTSVCVSVDCRFQVPKPIRWMTNDHQVLKKGTTHQVTYVTFSVSFLNVKLPRYTTVRSIFNVLLCVVESYACAAANLWVSIVKGIPVHVHL